ncbi:uncharacterized protein LOC135166535 isoform X2 [Diachasmimorpha longicaudata]|uniref:uncharacterized protein LOC135166535 isoform X2 n=1 Tax=Diachasmimorpha longicaudata TaxID=58733 RepID=UPI0030B8990B
MDINLTSDTGGAMACPVCTLYLREGISLQRHLDTHPKEQVIEALIKASSSSTSSPLPTLPSSSPSPLPQGSSQGSTPQPGVSQGQSHLPQSSYPIGPVFEYPPLNAMMPPQFASFSYQQFVNNGTMMIPQYSIPPPPQANQMMQMLYNPYNMYQQQQVPTVQMLSPVTTIPTTRIRPVVTVAESISRSIMMPSSQEGKTIIPDMIESTESILPDIETPEVTERRTEDRQTEDRGQQTLSRRSSPPAQKDDEEDEGESIIPEIEEPRDEHVLQRLPDYQKEREDERTGERTDIEKMITDDSREDQPNDKETSSTTEEAGNSLKISMRVEIPQQGEVEHLERFLVNIMETNLERSEVKKPEESQDDVRELPVQTIEDESPELRELRRELTVEIDYKALEVSYRYKNSLSAPASPTVSKKPNHTFSRSEYGSIENLSLYPVGFDASALQELEEDNREEEEDEEEETDEKNIPDNFDEEDMEIEEIASPHTPFAKGSQENRSHTPLSTISGISGLKLKTNLAKPGSPASVQSFRGLNGESEDDESEDNQKNPLDCSQGEGELEGNRRFDPSCHQSVITEHVSSFPVHSNQQISSESYSMVSTKGQGQDLAAIVGMDPTTSDSKSFQSIAKTMNQIPTTELLNINEDAHSGPMNVFEFDGLQILVPSTFISESSQKAISATSQQSMASSEGGGGIDEEVKSVNMRADETMPPRGELSEQESNGCTEHSAWQLYVGQESSRMSTSYDLMARESWEESEGSDNEAGVPLLDSRSLATHFTSSLFLDRDRKTPTKRTFKCSLCTEVFDCPKERRVHSTTVHKEAGPSNSSSNSGPLEVPEAKDIKLLEGRMNVFEEIFVPGIHVPTYHQSQPPLLHQLQPPQQPSDLTKPDGDEKVETSTGLEISCAMCSQRFSSERSLQVHNRRVHGTEVAKRLHDISKCQICNEEFPSVVQFNAHLKIHPLECSQCGKYFYRKQNFKLHMKRHLGIKPFPCTVCDKAFLTKQKLDEHMNGHTGNAPVKCNLCNETFRRYSNLTQHKNRHHLNIKRKLKDYICHCGEVFHTKKKLAWHKETHDEKPKACTYCNERFIHMASLTRHMRRAHNRRFVPDAQRENENVECPICKCIYLRSSLSVHMRVHNGERPYECQVCSKAFSTKWNLQLHKWTHAARSTKPYKCNQCSAAFYRHSDYTAHMNSHRNVRPYTCNYCGAQFIRKYNCLRHVKEHEENKQYTCDVCNKTFHRSYYLKEHLRVHSGARPYTCHICGKSSSTKSNHNKHVRIHHAREPVNTEN